MRPNQRIRLLRQDSQIDSCIGNQITTKLNESRYTMKMIVHFKPNEAQLARNPEAKGNVGLFDAYVKPIDEEGNMFACRLTATSTANPTIKSREQLIADAEEARKYQEAIDDDREWSQSLAGLVTTAGEVLDS